MTTDTQAPDHEALGALLRRIEGDAHRRGWDGDPALYVLYDARDRETEAAYRNVMRGVPIRCAPHAALPAVPSGALAGNPASALFRFALNLRSEHPWVEAILHILRQPGFVGMAFLVEAWMRTFDTKDERESLGKVRFADVPGSIEIRDVLAADISGRDFCVQRQRGGKAEMIEPDGEMSGAVIESLRTIVAAVLGRPLPDIENTPSTWNWDAERANAIHVPPDPS